MAGPQLHQKCGKAFWFCCSRLKSVHNASVLITHGQQGQIVSRLDSSCTHRRSIRLGSTSAALHAAWRKGVSILPHHHSKKYQNFHKIHSEFSQYMPCPKFDNFLAFCQLSLELCNPCTRTRTCVRVRVRPHTHTQTQTHQREPRQACSPAAAARLFILMKRGTRSND